MTFDQFFRLRQLCSAVRNFSNSHEFAITRAMIRDCFSQTYQVIFTRLYPRPDLPSSPSFSHLFDIMSRFDTARKIAKKVTRNMKSEFWIGGRRSVAFKRMVKNLTPYIVILGHFFELYRASLVDFVSDSVAWGDFVRRLHAGFYTGGQRKPRIEIELGILRNCYHETAYMPLIILYGWVRQTIANGLYNRQPLMRLWEGRPYCTEIGTFYDVRLVLQSPLEPYLPEQRFLSCDVNSFLQFVLLHFFTWKSFKAPFCTFLRNKLTWKPTIDLCLHRPGGGLRCTQRTLDTARSDNRFPISSSCWGHCTNK